MSLKSCIHDVLRRVRRNKQGVALIEFALVAPILVLLIFTGLELAHFAIARLKITQISRMAADVVGRYQPSLSLTNVDDVITGVKKAGAGIDFATRGRIIISGVQRNAAGTGQWINWQRCAGAKVYSSSYGVADQGFADTTVQGLGTANSQISAPTSGLYIIFVEIAYDYQSLLSNTFIGTPVMKSTQAFIVRARQSGNIQGAYTMDSGGNYIRSSGATGTRTATAQGNSTDNCANYSA